MLPAPVDRRLKVAIVAPTFGYLGGQAVQADSLLRAWQDDPEVHARFVPVNPTPPRPFHLAMDIKYVRTLATQLTYWPLLVRELRRVDVVHVFSASYYAFLLAALPAVLVARQFGKPVVLNYHSGEAPDHLRRSALARRVLRQVERNAVPSSFLHDVFAGFGIQADVVPNIVDVDRFGFRERGTLAPNILSTRNFEEMYNVSCTLRAFRLVQHQRPEATLTLVGGGSGEAALRALAAELQLRNVRFIGRVRPSEIWRYYADADIYLQTPNIDNMPVSILEAFSSGCAVVATNAGGVPAILTHGEHGLLVNSDDHEAAAASVLRLLDEPALADRLTRTARESCERYRWTNVRHQWLDIYRSVVGPSGVPDPTPA